MAIGLFLLTIFNSICQHQFFWRSMATGVLTRTALVGSLYKRGLALTPRERTIHPGSALVNHMSTDISRIDYAVCFPLNTRSKLCISSSLFFTFYFRDVFMLIRSL
jgi:hypothetical protein